MGARRGRRPSRSVPRRPVVQVLEKALVGVAALVLTLALTLVADEFRTPVSDPPADAGPIVALGGGGRERLDQALLLRGVSERTLVLSTSAIDEWRAMGGSCDDPTVRCIDPNPIDTRGEARVVASFAADEEWTEVTVVTSRFHVPRSRWLFAHCVDADVRLVGATLPGASSEVAPRLAAREAVATAASMLVHRSC